MRSRTIEDDFEFFYIFGLLYLNCNKIKAKLSVYLKNVTFWMRKKFIKSSFPQKNTLIMGSLTQSVEQISLNSNVWRRYLFKKRLPKYGKDKNINITKKNFSSCWPCSGYRGCTLCWQQFLFYGYYRLRFL